VKALPAFRGLRAFKGCKATQASRVQLDYKDHRAFKGPKVYREFKANRVQLASVLQELMVPQAHKVRRVRDCKVRPARACRVRQGFKEQLVLGARVRSDHKVLLVLKVQRV
jgi:hypothetical protein